MSLQVFLQAQISGTDAFLATQSPDTSDSFSDFLGRAAWLGLLGEVLPRALLSELKLSRMLLGSSSAEQFFLVLTEDDMPRANEFLARAATAISALSQDAIRLDWVSTENLGAWPIVRKRLDDAMGARSSSPLANTANPANAFAPYTLESATSETTYFVQFGLGFFTAQRVGWSLTDPAHLTWDSGDISWPLSEQTDDTEDSILFPRRFAMDENANGISSLTELAAMSDGASHWGILRADVDQFDIRLRSAASIEDHILSSILLKRFIAGEMAFLCTLPEFWRKVTLLYRGGDDFAVLGAWDALIPFAREVHRVFESFVETNLKDAAGVEGKSISLALAIAPHIDTPVAMVFEEAGNALRSTKATEPGNLFLFGRTLEWKRLADADELKTALVRMVRDFGFASDFVHDLASVYRESGPTTSARRGRPVRIEKPWRTYMQVSSVLPPGRTKEFANLRNTIITHLLGRKTSGMKLRPSSRVGLEWARLGAADKN